MRADVPEGEQYDDWRAALDRASNLIRKSGKRTPDRDLRAVEGALSSAMNAAGATAEDISEDTSIPRASVVAILDALIALGVAYKTPKHSPTSRGRKLWIYHLTGRVASTDLVLP